MIFTDGSVWEGSVGSGACAAVLFSKFENDDVWIQNSAVGTRVSAFECEVEWVGLGIMKFCPLEYIKVMSKELDRAISGSNLVKPEIAFL